MRQLFYTINTFLRPYNKIIYKVINFISMLIIFILGFVTGLVLAKYGYIDLGALSWVR